ncbi:MAG: peptidase S9, partial [Rikenellaceae bacterium]
MKKQLLLMATASIMAACGGSASPSATQTEDFKLDTAMTQAQKDARLFTTEVIWKMGRMGSAKLSPDGTTVLYTLTRYNVEQNRSSTTIWSQPFGSGTPVQLTTWNFSDNSAAWSADSKRIYFMSNRENGSQLWVMNADGSGMTRISDVEGGIGGFGVNSTEDKVWYASEVHVEDVSSADRYKDMPKSKALVYDDLMVRHWDCWEDGSYSHIFVADLKGGKLSGAKDINQGEPWDVPTAPYFDADEISWNNSGTALAYTASKSVGYEYAISTNSDIFLYTVADGSTKNLTEGMPGYDKYPVFSPDDSQIAWLSMERAGNESDKDRLFVMDANGANKKYLTPDFDYNAGGLVWNAEGTILTFCAPIEATHQLCEVTLSGEVSVMTSGDHYYTSFSRVGENIAANRTTLSSDNEWYAVNPSDGEATQRSFINKEIYDNVEMGQVQKRWVTTTDNKQMLTWVVLPPNFDESKSYPTLLYCQGGPQSVVSQRWSYRWNFQLMSAQGYIIVAPNRRG